MFYVIKMSSKVFAREISDVASYEIDIQDLVDAGDIVILTDNVGCAADLLGIDEADIEMVD